MILPSTISFWKIDPVPESNNQIEVSSLKSFGRPDQVIDKLLDFPKMYRMPRTVQDLLCGVIRVKLLWEYKNGVLLFFQTEPEPYLHSGEVVVINAISQVPNDTFYRLYVQLFEALNCILLDTNSHKFIPPKEFSKFFNN